jgi:hypothetical protein
MGVTDCFDSFFFSGFAFELGEISMGFEVKAE